MTPPQRPWLVSSLPVSSQLSVESPIAPVTALTVLLSPLIMRVFPHVVNLMGAGAPSLFLYCVTYADIDSYRIIHMI